MGGVFLGVAGFTFGYGQGWSYLSNDPAVCANCHIMREHYASWQQSSHHTVATCNDCHIPHDFLPKYLAKLENGFQHSRAFTFQDFHEPIRIRPRNRAVLNHNCVSCHSDLTAQTHPGGPEDAAQAGCVRCHASVGHAASD
jgi:cytochrome c nitrite reductase small subunit